MELRSTLHHVDRKAEHARKFRPDGSLEAERIRLRERETHVPYRLPGTEGGCLVRWVKGVVGVGFLYFFVSAGAWVGGWRGGAIAVAIIAAHWALQDD